MDEDKSHEDYVPPRAPKSFDSVDLFPHTVEKSNEEESIFNQDTSTTSAYYSQERSKEESVSRVVLPVVPNVSIKQELINYAVFIGMVGVFFKMEALIHKVSGMWHWLKIPCTAFISVFSCGNGEWTERVVRIKNLLSATGAQLVKEEIPEHVRDKFWLKSSYLIACSIVDSLAVKSMVIQRTVALALGNICHAFMGTEEFVYTAAENPAIPKYLTDFLVSKDMIVQVINYNQAVGTEYETELKPLRGLCLAFFVVSYEIYCFYRTFGAIIRIVFSL